MKQDKAGGENFVSVVLPVYNEAATIQADIEAIQAALSAASRPFEIIVVDDGSEDETAQIAEAKGVRVIRHAINRGVGAARKTGVLEAEGEIIVTSDADGTYPLADIPRLLEFLPDYDMAIGARIGKVVQEPFYRKMPKYLICRLASYLVPARKVPPKRFSSCAEKNLLHFCRFSPAF